MAISKTRLDMKIAKIESKAKKMQEQLEQLISLRKTMVSLDEDPDVKQILAMAEEVANKKNIPIDRILKAICSKRRGPKKPAPVKYRDPIDSNNTWSGRGIKPLWLQRYLASGRDLSEFKVNDDFVDTANDSQVE